MLVAKKFAQVLRIYSDGNVMMALVKYFSNKARRTDLNIDKFLFHDYLVRQVEENSSHKLV